MKASVGRIVHFTAADGKPRPAIIGMVTNEQTQEVNLHVFGDCVKETGSKAQRMVPYSETPKAHYWSWPPKVE